MVIERFMPRSPEYDLWRDCENCDGTGEVKGTESDLVAHLGFMYGSNASAGAIADQFREWWENEVVPCKKCEGSGRVEVVV